MKRLSITLALLSAIVSLEAIATGIKYQNNHVYQTSQNGKSYVILLGSPNSLVTLSWQPEPISGKILARKTKTYTLNECGFKNVAINLKFPLYFKRSEGAIDLNNEWGFATQYLQEAPALPICRNVGADKIPYVIQGWQP
jgi:hypothetical protein